MIKKTVRVSSAQFFIKLCDFGQGLLHCYFTPDEDNKKTEITINVKNQFIRHECAEFKKENMYYKKFCSHLIKLFLILKESCPKEALNFLKHIQLEDYDFFPKKSRNIKNSS